MSFQIVFDVPGIPVSKARARSFITKQGKMGHYTPSKTKGWEDLVAIKARLAMSMNKLQPWEFSIALKACFYFPLPKSRKSTEDHLSKPDVDNLAKAIMDGCNGIVYVDDSHITDLHVSKCYTQNGPRVEINITLY